MEPEGSLPQLQVPATCPYPEPARSSPYPHILLPEDPFNLLNPTGHVMHQQFNIQQLYVLPALYLCV